MPQNEQQQALKVIEKLIWDRELDLSDGYDRHRLHPDAVVHELAQEILRTMIRMQVAS